jgi:hypothetical protein
MYAISVNDPPRNIIPALLLEPVFGVELGVDDVLFPFEPGQKSTSAKPVVVKAPLP